MANFKLVKLRAKQAKPKTQEKKVKKFFKTLTTSIAEHFVHMFALDHKVRHGTPLTLVEKADLFWEHDKVSKMFENIDMLQEEWANLNVSLAFPVWAKMEQMTTAFNTVTLFLDKQAISAESSQFNLTRTKLANEGDESDSDSDVDSDGGENVFNTARDDIANDSIYKEVFLCP